MSYTELMKEFSVTLANQPGQLATLARRLSNAGIHIESLAAIGSDTESLVRLMTDNSDATRRVLKEAGLHFDERPVLDTFLPDEPGALAEVAQRLADAGVNIDSIYLLHSNAEGLHSAVPVDDPEAARANLAGASTFRRVFVGASKIRKTTADRSPAFPRMRCSVMPVRYAASRRLWPVDPRRSRHVDGADGPRHVV